MSSAVMCAYCGARVGDKGKDDRPITCLKLGRAVCGVGLVCWCDDDCMRAWDVKNVIELTSDEGSRQW